MLLPVGLLHNLEGDPQPAPGELHALAGVAAVGPHPCDRGHLHPGPVQHESTAVAVLQAGRGDQHHHQQPGRVDDHMSLAPIDLLARVVPARALADGVGTIDRLGSTIPADAIGSRPAASRAASCSASWIRLVVPSAFHRLKYQYTVSQGGKSCGSCRHEHPVRFRYKMASTIRRRGCFASRPPGLTGPSARSMPTAHRSGRTGTGRGKSTPCNHAGDSSHISHAAHGRSLITFSEGWLR